MIKADLSYTKYLLIAIYVYLFLPSVLKEAMRVKSLRSGIILKSKKMAF